eukprot:TRINITY_DN408_c0_g1_i6.p1 TRINITY_DN408_c0_g1~~TRINITY_DN408_c0_g1_i6.p1  ORF type:complete len:545 (-),score=100.08 TRINITY_DN408_c0_g1_i6:56-1690(-)
MASAGIETYVLEQLSVADESEEEYNYEEVPIDSDNEEEGHDEDLQSALRALKARDEAKDKEDVSKPMVAKKPEVIDDFFRNFLNRNGLYKTLEVFETEWYDLQQQGKISPEQAGVVPDVYVKNQALDDVIRKLRVEIEEYREIAQKAQSTWDKLRKERDFHRMHHRRAVQEKNKLVTDLKNLKRHYSMYEPALQQLQKKYETAMKEKMLAKLERDRIQAKVESMETTLKQYDATKTTSLQSQVPQVTMDKLQNSKKKKSTKDSTLPVEDRVNPFAQLAFTPATVESYTLQKVIKAHDMAISSVALHPKKPIIATVSDDRTWKMWSVQTGELIMSGDGHKDWVSGADFHPKGTHLVTASGDSTVKIWDFAEASCAVTFTDHTQAVWGCAFHDSGDFVVSCSLDHTAKLLDINSRRCRTTFRGHVDSVNAVVFQPFTNVICTGSGDKTVSLWDCRTGLCAQTFYGHMNACNDVAFNKRGDTIASTDADGVVKVWDVRMIQERASINVGPHPGKLIRIRCTFPFEVIQSKCVPSPRAHTHNFISLVT